jgi:hypothetical protein
MRRRTLLCQRSNVWPLKTSLWSPTLLTRLIWRLVIYSCFRERNRNCQGVVFRMCWKFKNNCWLSYTRSQKVSSSGDCSSGRNAVPLRTFGWGLTPWSRVLLEKLTGHQLVKKFPAFYGTRRFITAFTRAHHLSLSWAIGCTKESVQVRCPVKCFVTWSFFTMRSC